MEERFTPEFITALGTNEVFVFGSNLAGNHASGAARVARERFGAIMGQGVGLQGQSYAIPTMQGGVGTIRPYVDSFVEFAAERPHIIFYVTRIGCGIAGFKDEQIAPLFADALHLRNVVLPESFVNILRQGCFAKSYLDNWQGRYSSYDMAIDYLLLLNRLHIYGQYDMDKALSNHEEILRQAMRSSRHYLVPLSKGPNRYSPYEIAYGIKLYLLDFERIISHSDPSIVPCLRYVYSMTAELAGNMHDIYGVPETAGSSSEFINTLTFIITGRWNGEDNSVVYDSIWDAYPVFTAAVRENWHDMLTDGRLDESKILKAFSNPHIWSAWTRIAKHGQAVFRCLYPLLNSLCFIKHGGYMNDRNIVFIPRNDCSLPVFDAGQGRLNFPNNELKKAFIERVRSELSRQ